jgi:two-component system response regulator NreC
VVPADESSESEGQPVERKGPKFRILIADGQILFRRGLVTLLAAEHDIGSVEEAATFEEAVQFARSQVPDLLVTDAGLLKGSIQEKLAALKPLERPVPVLVLAAEGLEHEAEDAVRAGARGFLLKNSSPAQLVGGICSSFRSDGWNARIMGDTAADLRALANSSQAYSNQTALTAREQEILKLLAEGRTVRETASELSLSMKTVEAHKLNLMRKLDIHNRATLIEFAAATGVIQPVNH